MILTVGYQRLPKGQLKELVVTFNAIVMDVRAKPTSRRADFRRPALEKSLGERYEWAGDWLGGPAFTGVPISDASIKRLADRGQNENVVLMCMEEAPGECHRHHDIGVKIAGCAHIFRDQLILACELQRAIDEDDSYEFDSLSDWLDTF